MNHIILDVVQLKAKLIKMSDKNIKITTITPEQSDAPTRNDGWRIYPRVGTRELDTPK